MGRRAWPVLALLAAIVIAGVTVRSGVEPPPVEVERSPPPAPDPPATPEPLQPDLALHALDPLTLDDRVGPRALPIVGPDAGLTVSAEAGIVAVAGPASVDGPSTLVVLRVADLSQRSPAGTTPGSVAHLAVGDDDALHWLEAPSGAGPWLLRRVSLRAASAQLAVATTRALPEGVEPDALQVLPQGRVAVFDAGSDTRPPRFVIADRDDAAPVEVEIAVTPVAVDGAGWQRLTPAVDGAGWQRLTPAVDWGADGAHAYVAHTDGDRVSVVDLDAGTVADTIDAGPGLLGGVPAAHANADVGIGVTRDLAVAPDDATFYLGGWRVISEQGVESVRHPRQLPLPIIALDTSTGALQARRRPAPERVLSVDPTGRTLFVVEGWWADGDPRRGRLLDADTLATRARLVGGAAVTAAAYTDDGRHLWLVRHAPGRALLEAIDVDTGDVIAARTFSGHAIDAIDPDAGVALVRRR